MNEFWVFLRYTLQAPERDRRLEVITSHPPTALA